MMEYELMLIPSILLYLMIFLVAAWLGNRPDNPVSASVLMGCSILGLVLLLCEYTRLFV